MNDLFLTPAARGSGTAAALIDACLERARQHGAGSLTWQTARDNARAQALYERVGAKRDEWIDYSLET
jgi:GNAT superfamily N-acetyltransferase